VFTVPNAAPFAVGCKDTEHRNAAKIGRKRIRLKIGSKCTYTNIEFSNTSVAVLSEEPLPEDGRKIQRSFDF
jgi:hypothetical protein